MPKRTRTSKRTRTPRAEPQRVELTDRMLTTKLLQLKLGGVSRVTVWRAVRDKRLPQPNRLISRRVPLWSEREIDALLAQSAGQTTAPT
jgi:predicted DNA-binding transcriptional regulator AlpA